ncbi:hypothetical protein PtA15_13A362 [Puccinia triticina]|uniref:Uncharacterized protein n=1 Tax=Puccinia triticina TaxID=208348 RepID=A0ABY7D3V8_9BASI|nr:uncharacterized protein PtA15_13A362 [Puccinia triticina]WAQ90962.1 hypothetical protein PtA15_13A362 [Puccinia triticina]
MDLAVASAKGNRYHRPSRSCGLLSPMVLLHLPNGTLFVTMLLAAGLTFTMANRS